MDSTLLNTRATFDAKTFRHYWVITF